MAASTTASSAASGSVTRSRGSSVIARPDELGATPDLHLRRGNVPTAWCERSAEVFGGKETD